MISSLDRELVSKLRKIQCEAPSYKETKTSEFLRMIPSAQDIFMQGNQRSPRLKNSGLSRSLDLQIIREGLRLKLFQSYRGGKGGSLYMTSLAQSLVGTIDFYFDQLARSLKNEKASEKAKNLAYVQWRDLALESFKLRLILLKEANNINKGKSPNYRMLGRRLKKNQAVQRIAHEIPGRDIMIARFFCELKSDELDRLELRDCQRRLKVSNTILEFIDCLDLKRPAF